MRETLWASWPIFIFSNIMLVAPSESVIQGFLGVSTLETGEHHTGVAVFFRKPVV